MPICCHCKTFFCHASLEGPSESCDCERDETATEARRREMAEREPTEDELEARRAETAR